MLVKDILAMRSLAKEFVDTTYEILQVGEDRPPLSLDTNVEINDPKLADELRTLIKMLQALAG